MKNQRRGLLTIALILPLAILSFGAGFLFNDLIFSPGESIFNEEQGDLGIYWEAWGYINEHFIGDLPDTKHVAYGAVRGSIDTLGDPYTIFIEPEVREREKERFRGNFGGIGATLVRDEDGNLILNPIKGNPAEEAGILEGDILLAVDGQEIGQELTVQEIADKVGANILLHGHEPCPDGYDVLNTRQIILDSMGEKGSYVILKVGENYTQDEIVKRIKRLRKP